MANTLMTDSDKAFIDKVANFNVENINNQDRLVVFMLDNRYNCFYRDISGLSKEEIKEQKEYLYVAMYNELARKTIELKP